MRRSKVQWNLDYTGFGYNIYQMFNIVAADIATEKLFRK